MSATQRARWILKKMVSSAIRRGLSRRFAPVNSSRSTNEKNVDSFQNMPRRTQAQILAADASAFIGQLATRSRTRARTRFLRTAAQVVQRIERRRQRRRERRGVTYRIGDWNDQAFGPDPEHFLLTIFKRHAGQHIRVVAFSGAPPEDDEGHLSCGPPYYCAIRSSVRHTDWPVFTLSVLGPRDRCDTF